MSQHFNLTRFGRLLRKHTAEHWTSYLLGAVVLLGAMLLVMGFIAYLTGGPLSLGLQQVFFTLFLLAAGSFFASTAFVEFGAGRQAALALTLPASQLEKYLVAWLVSLPVFFGVFVAAFYAADWLVMQLSTPTGPALLLLNLFSEQAHVAEPLLLYLVLHAVALWGSIFFQKLQFIKTAGWFLAALVVVVAVNYQWLKVLVTDELRMAIPFGKAGLLDGSLLRLPEAQQPWLPLLPLVLAGLLWAAAYARLTEKQI